MDTEEILRKIENSVKEDLIDGELDYFEFHKHRYFYIFDLLKEKYSQGSKFLEIGSFCGHILLGGKSIGYEPYGCDLSESCAKTSGRFAKLNIKNLPCDLSAGALPYENNSFDVVLLSETLEHFNFHPGLVFQEIARVLKSNGLIIITTPNLLRLNNKVKILIGRSINWDISLPYDSMSHYREYSAEEIVYLMAANKLKAKEISYADFDYPDIKKFYKFINRIAGLFAGSLKGNIVVIGKK